MSSSRIPSERYQRQADDIYERLSAKDRAADQKQGLGKWQDKAAIAVGKAGLLGSNLLVDSALDVPKFGQDLPDAWKNTRNAGRSLAQGDYKDALISSGKAAGLLWEEAGRISGPLGLVAKAVRGGRAGRRLALGITEIGKAGAKSDTIKKSHEAPVIIGENMQRVKEYADKMGGVIYKPWKSNPFNKDLAMKRNKLWIRDKMNKGREIVDIGPNFQRRKTEGKISTFYAMEREILKSYNKYKKVFRRKGKLRGGVPELHEW